jgi:hypothetical protein
MAFGSGNQGGTGPPVSRVIVASIAAVAVLVPLTGCGGSSKKPSTSAAAVSSPVEKVERSWTEFFEGSTPPSRKVALLQKGQLFAPVIQAEASSPLAKQVKVTVSRVTLLSPSRATVLYTIMIAGRPALANQVGTAVLEGGSWRVGARSFCALLALEGAAPPACHRV